MENIRVYVPTCLAIAITSIHQHVPTYFHAVQRSRLPMVAMPMDRGLSDTNVGEANHTYSIKKCNNWRFVAHPITYTGSMPIFQKYYVVGAGKLP